PTIGDTTLTLGSLPYCSPKCCFTSFTWSSDKTVSNRLTAISLLSPERTIDFASKPSTSKPSSISSVVNDSSASTSTLVPLVKSIQVFILKTVKEITPTITLANEAYRNFFRCCTTSIFRFMNVASFSSFAAISLIDFFFTPNHVGRFFKNGLRIQSESNNRVQKTAVRKLTRILIIKIVANPLTELVPK